MVKLFHMKQLENYQEKGEDFVPHETFVQKNRSPN